MGLHLVSPGDGRLQGKRFWNFFAIIQFCILLWMVFNAKDWIDTRSLPPASKLSGFTGNEDEALEKGNSQFNSAELEMFQSQTNLKLVREIRDKWLKPPSKLPYNFTVDKTKNLGAVKRMQKVVLDQFGGKRNGFFIECGALDGVRLSNTLHLEKDFNWTGLLIEAEPTNYGELMTKQRKAWSINACLSMKPHEETVRMTRIKNHGALSIISELADKEFRRRPHVEEFDVQCFPLASILVAVRRTLNIDYFSLDVEGAELKILQAVPWDFVYIKVISLEANEKRIGPLTAFLATKNYKCIKHVKGEWINDHIFVHKQFIHDQKSVHKSK